MNFGAFAGGFAEGFDRGQRIAKSIRETIRENRLQEMREKALEEANSAREQAVNGLITENKDAVEESAKAPVSDAVKPSTDGAPSVDLTPAQESKPSVTIEPSVTGPATGMPAKVEVGPDGGLKAPEIEIKTQDGAKPEAAAKKDGEATQAFFAGGTTPYGLVEPGNIDLNSRKVLRDGNTFKTEESISINVDGKEVLIPTVINGQKLSDPDAIDHFKKTGEHLGIFDTPENANAYANTLHERQQEFYGPSQAMPPNKPAVAATAAPASAPSVPEAGPAAGMPPVRDQRFSGATQNMSGSPEPAAPAQSAMNAPAAAQAAEAPAVAPSAAASAAPPSVPVQSAAPAQTAEPAASPAQSAAQPATTGSITPAAAPAAAPSSTQSAVTTTGVATKAPEPVKIEGKYVVNGKGYKTMAEARKAAEAAVPSTMEYFMRNGVPKIAEEYVRQGDPAKAEAWMKWSETSQNQASMREWSSMYRAAQMGDFEKAADHAFKLYQRYEDGITPLSKEVVKNKDGEVTGFNVRLRRDASGEEMTQFIDRRAMIEMGLAALSPPQMFEAMWKRQTEVDKTAAEARIKLQDRAAKREDDRALEEFKQDRLDQREKAKGQQRLSEVALKGQLDAANLGAKERAQAKAKIDMLQEAGYGEEQIKAMIPAIVGAGEHKKTTDPTERRALIFSDMTKNDPTFARRPKEEQEKIVGQAMDVIYGGEKPAGAQPGASSSAAKPTGNAAFDSAAEGAMFKDKSGNIYKKQNGQPVLVQKAGSTPAPAQAAPPAAGGMPPRQGGASGNW